MNHYAAYGLTIASNRPLRGLHPTRGRSVDATIDFAAGRAPVVDPGARETSATDGWRAVRRLEDGGLVFLLASHRATRAWSMLVTPDGRRIEVRWQGAVDPDDIAVLVQSTGLPALLARRGVPLLHGCALAVDDRAIVVLGGSGAGKSTVAAAALASGHSILADDVAAFSAHAHGIDVLPGLAQVRLNQDTVRGLGWEPDRIRRLFAEPATADRRWLELSPGTGFCDQPRPVGAVYVLGPRRSTAPRIEGLEPGRALPSLLRHTHAGFATDDATRAAQLPFWTRLAHHVPIRRVWLADDIAATASLVEELAADSARSRSRAVRPRRAGSG